ncbi:MAG: hypothetical protein JOZ98_00505 [Solirubrobacterales bacterium]|nr:hypothetical protein [Solirubrobacterales bacterium]
MAQVALEAASGVSGVVGADPGRHGLCVTADPLAGLLRGVSVTAQADGRYEVDLCLVAGIVPLLELGEEVRSKLRARVRREGLVAQLGEVNVGFVRVLSAGEISEQAAREREEALAATPPPTPAAPPVSTTDPAAPPTASALRETLAAQAAPRREETFAAEIAREREEVAQERTLVAQERTLVAQERTLVAQEREEIAREREEVIAHEAPSQPRAPSVSASDPIVPRPSAPADGEQPS